MPQPLLGVAAPPTPALPAAAPPAALPLPPAPPDVGEPPAAAPPEDAPPDEAPPDEAPPDVAPPLVPWVPLAPIAFGGPASGLEQAATKSPPNRPTNLAERSGIVMTAPWNEASRFAIRIGHATRNRRRDVGGSSLGVWDRSSGFPKNRSVKVISKRLTRRPRRRARACEDRSLRTRPSRNRSRDLPARRRPAPRAD